MVLNPKCDIEDRQKWTSALETWSRLDLCPLEDPDYRHQSTRRNLAAPPEAVDTEEEAAEDVDKSPPAILGIIENETPPRKKRRKSQKPRTIFHMALDALTIDWNNPQLLEILSNTKPDAHLLWQEHVPTACARVDALKTHGYDEDALKLAVAVARTLKHNQSVSHKHWLQNQENYATMQWSASGVARKPAFACPQGWIGHALNPLGCLFNTLVEPCILPDDKPRLGCHLELSPSSASSTGSPDASSSSPSSSSVAEGVTSSPLKYYHQPLSADDSFMVLAVESALIALGQQRTMPAGLYSQEKALKQEQRIISKLQELDLDPILLKVHARQAATQLEMGPTSGIGFGIHPESIPMQTFAKYLFHTLLPHEFELAFKVGLRAMRMPILDEMEKEELPALVAAVAQHQHQQDQRDPDDPLPPPPSSYVMNRLPRWYTIGHIESQQCSLASRMLNAAKGTPLHTILSF